MAHREMAATLAEWREIERQLQEVDDGTPEAEQLQTHAAELRNEVQRLTIQTPPAAGPEVALSS